MKFVYIIDMCVTWLNSSEQFHIVLRHINNIHKDIDFPMEFEKNKKLSFLDILAINKMSTSTYIPIHTTNQHSSEFASKPVQLLLHLTDTEHKYRNLID